MVLPVFLLLAIPLAWLAARSWRWAVGQTLTGAAILGALFAMGKLRIVWPDFGFPLALVLNPYLVLTLGYLLVIAGAIGLLAAGRRALLRRQRA